MGAPRHLDVVLRVTSPDEVTSPFTRARAAFFHVELVEVEADGNARSLGALMIGDVVRLSSERVALSVVVRRAVMRFVDVRRGGVPLEHLATVPAEAVPLLASARGRGTICFREHAVVRGASLRVRAFVEGPDHTTGFGRSTGAALPDGLVVRGDVGPITLDEVLDGGPPRSP